MNTNIKRVCVFCGNKPQTKTREHVVPYWLLEMTGDPTRTVTFGINFQKDKSEIRYSWSSFVVPACDDCNNRYSEMEGRVKHYISALQQRESLTAAQYIELLDWLDKIRIGVWLARQLIENCPIYYTPNFYIDSRIARKDRMVAVYAFEGDGKGINLFGNDSMISRKMPSCIGLRINNLLLINASSDFFCSKGCGLPAPEKMLYMHGGANDGGLRFQGVYYSTKTSNPVTTLPLKKPAVWLYQPIYSPNDEKFPNGQKIFQGNYYGHYNSYDSNIAAKTLYGTSSMGAIFRQWSETVEIINNPDEEISFDNVSMTECSTMAENAATVYESQIILRDMYDSEWINPKEPTKFYDDLKAAEFESNNKFAEMYRNMVAS